MIAIRNCAEALEPLGDPDAITGAIFVVQIMVPAQVGVNRRGPRSSSRARRCPHAGGGEPVKPAVRGRLELSSPRAWG